MPDVIVLTLPPDPRYATVARIVVGGLAARIGLTYEALDDLQLAVESVLAQETPVGDVTLEVSPGEGAVAILLGPFRGNGADRDTAAGGLDLSTVLAAVVDEVGSEDRDGARWLRLVKRVSLVER